MSTSTHHDALPELAAVEIKGMTRESFLVRGALAAGAVYGMGMIGPFVRNATAAEAMTDIDILNFALTLEYLEAAFYQRAPKQAKLSGELLTIVQEIGANEAEHVKVLTQTITGAGGTPVKAPTVAFTMTNEAEFLKLAVTLEDTGVSAYNGAGPSIQSKDVLAAAGSIVQVEARHAAVLRLFANELPAPDSFDKSLTTNEVLAAVKPFVKA